MEYLLLVKDFKKIISYTQMIMYNVYISYNWIGYTYMDYFNFVHNFLYYLYISLLFLGYSRLNSKYK